MKQKTTRIRIFLPALVGILLLSMAATSTPLQAGEISGRRTADEIITEIDLKVLTQQYERVSMELFETERDAQTTELISSLAGERSKEELARQTRAVQLKLKVLQDWRSRLRQQIEEVAHKSRELEIIRRKESQDSQLNPPTNPPAHRGESPDSPRPNPPKNSPSPSTPPPGSPAVF